jgi:processive 1,2-diacylglycerol beta-glucosyltransferase
LEPDRVTVLVTSGGDTVGPFEAVVSSLMALETVLPKRLQLLVICGHDARMVHRLRHRAQQCTMPIRIEGFIETMPQAMAASDVVVAKAGGLTISEAMVRGLPLILYHAIPGQERFNAQYLARRGAAVVARRPQEVAQIVRYFVEHPEDFSAMRKAESRIGRPEAAEAIVAKVIKPLLDSSMGSGTGRPVSGTFFMSPSENGA